MYMFDRILFEVEQLYQFCHLGVSKSKQRLSCWTRYLICVCCCTGHVHVAEYLNIPLHIYFTMPWTYALFNFSCHLFLVYSVMNVQTACRIFGL
jgi:hypothetical protein